MGSFAMIATIAAWALLLAILAAVAWTDRREQRIPNGLSGALLLVGLMAARLPSGPGLPAAAIGALLGGVVLLAVALGFRRLRGIDGLGLGDVKFLAGAGAWTGWQGIGPMIFIAAMAALAWLAVQRLAGVKHDRHARIAFGPYLCLGLLIVRMTQCTFGNKWEIFSH